MCTLDRICELLKEQKKKQKDLTDFLGLTKNTFTNWKLGTSESYKKHIDKIADFFGVSTDYLLGKEKNTATPSNEETTVLTEHEKRIIMAYRNKPELQNSVNILLDVKPDADLVDDMIETINKTSVRHPINKN